MKKQVYVLFETDSHKMKSSRVLLGVFSSFEGAWNAFIKDVLDEARGLPKNERCEMLGIDESTYGSNYINADYNSSWCYIVSTTLDVLEENNI